MSSEFFYDLLKEQIDMLKHAWGYDSKDPGFRSHYCTSIEDPLMKNLVAKGYFFGPHCVGSVGEGQGMFYLTDKAHTLLKRTRGSTNG